MMLNNLTEVVGPWSLGGENIIPIRKCCSKCLSRICVFISLLIRGNCWYIATPDVWRHLELFKSLPAEWLDCWGTPQALKYTCIMSLQSWMQKFNTWEGVNIGSSCMWPCKRCIYNCTRPVSEEQMALVISTQLSRGDLINGSTAWRSLYPTQVTIHSCRFQTGKIGLKKKQQITP